MNVLCARAHTYTLARAASWDVNSDGTVTRAEFHKAMATLGLEVPQGAVNHIFSSWDRSGDGEITLAELTTILHAASTTKKSLLALRKKLIKKGGKLGQTFRDWDADNSGEIDVDEFGKGLKAVGIDLPNEQMRALFASIDKDGSGSISFRELNKVIREDVEKEERAKRRKELEAKRIADEWAQYEEVVDVSTLRKATLSKLRAYEEDGWGAGKEVHAGLSHTSAAKAAMEQQRLPADASPRRRLLHDVGGSGAAANSAEAGEGGDGGGGVSPAKSSPERKKRALERSKLQMRLRLRGTGLVDGEGAAEATDPSLTSILRRLPRGPAKRLTQRSRRARVGNGERSAVGEAAADDQQDENDENDDDVYFASAASRVTVTRHGRLPVLRPSGSHPEALPRLIDVLSAHRMRAAVPCRRDFEVHTLPPLLQPGMHQPRKLRASASVRKLTEIDPSARQQHDQKRGSMRKSESLPLL